MTDFSKIYINLGLLLSQLIISRTNIFLQTDVLRKAVYKLGLRFSKRKFNLLIFFLIDQLDSFSYYT